MLQAPGVSEFLVDLLPELLEHLGQLPERLPFLWRIIQARHAISAPVAIGARLAVDLILQEAFLDGSLGDELPDQEPASRLRRFEDAVVLEREAVIFAKRLHINRGLEGRVEARVDRFSSLVLRPTKVSSQ